MWTAATTSWDSDRVAAGAEISDVVSRIRRFQTLTIIWMTAEAALSLCAAWRADAAESMLCAYLSLIALIGLAAAAFFHISWPDPVAALASTPLIIWEAREALKGRACGCH